ncbi:MAG: flavodoxin family protein [Anaerolineae bacterium]|jgi:flavodoxin
MKAIVVYFTKFGNTRRVAEVIAEALDAGGSVRVLAADQLTAADVKGADLLVMGTPTHRMNLPKAVRPVLESLPGGSLKGIPIAAFDTSYQMSWLLNQFTASKRLNRRLRKLGGKPIVPPATFLVVERQGPLLEGEIERAKTWAGTILTMHGRSCQHQHARRQ